MSLSLYGVARVYGDQTIFEDVSLILAPGERLGLVGENGSGKSSLLRVMAGLEAPDAGSVSALVPVALLAQFSETPQGDLTQVVTPPDLLAAQQVFDHALCGLADGTEAAALHFARAEETLRRAGGYDFPARAATVLSGLNLDSGGHAQALSGGQMRRLMLARLLLSPAGIYLLDEPTNHLDAQSARWLERWIAAQSASFVLASHDRAFLDAVSTRTAELERGHLSVYPGPYSAAMQIRAELRAAQGRQYEAGRRQWAALENEARRRQSKARSAGQYNANRASDGDKMLAKAKVQNAQNVNASRAKALEQQLERLVTADKPFDDRRTLHLELPPSPPGPGEVLSLRDLGVERGSRQVISGLNLKLRRGERLALTGPNGSGKSTLLAAIRGALPFTGELRLGAGLLLAWTGQGHEELAGLSTVQDALLHANPMLTPHQLYELAASVGLSEGPFQRVETLSGGQLTRLSFARLSVVRAQLLLLDEPTNHLDLRAIEALEALLLRFPGTVIFASHDRRLVERAATMRLELGKLEPGKLELWANWNWAAHRLSPAILHPVKAPFLPAPLVILRDVSVTQGGKAVLNDLNWQLLPGEAWLLTGPNGGGKSSFLGLLRGDLSPVSGTRTYHLEGQMRASAVRARRLFPLVSPSLEAWFLTRDWAQTVQDVLLAGLEGEMLNLGGPDQAALARLREVVALTGVEALLARDFRTLSHGQRRRSLLARALMPGPAALLLDEFTDGLSVSARAELKGVLEGVAAQGVAVILATHRPDEAPDLHWQRLHASGGRVEVQPHPGGAGLQNAAIQFQTRLPASRPVPLIPTPPLVTLHNASVYRNGHLALGPLSWEWRRGQHWLVTGENGAGKSTLARLLAGEFHPALGGSVRRHFLTRDLLSERRRSIGVVGAELSIRQRRGWTGFQLIASAYGGTEGFSGEVGALQARQVRVVAEQLGVANLLTRPADTLSQGQLGRLLLARAVVHAPTLLILDEALNFLDADAQRQVFGLLPGLMQAGTHLLVIAHRPQDAPPGLTDHLHLQAGRAAQD